MKKEFNDWQCPNCGSEADVDTLIETKNEEYNSDPNLSFGSYNWIEIHKCRNCGNIYEFENCNY